MDLIIFKENYHGTVLIGPSNKAIRQHIADHLMDYSHEHAANCDESEINGGWGPWPEDAKEARKFIIKNLEQKKCLDIVDSYEVDYCKIEDYDKQFISLR